MRSGEMGHKDEVVKRGIKWNGEISEVGLIIDYNRNGVIQVMIVVDGIKALGSKVRFHATSSKVRNPKSDKWADTLAGSKPKGRFMV